MVKGYSKVDFKHLMTHGRGTKVRRTAKNQTKAMKPRQRKARRNGAARRRRQCKTN